MVLYQTLLNVYGHIHATKVLEVGGGIRKILENSRNWIEFLSLNQVKCMHMCQNKSST
jgi:hypothetical protein